VVVIVDIHTHIFPPDLIARRDQLVRRDPLVEEMYGDPRAAMATAPELLGSMDTTGVNAAVVMGFTWADPGLCRHHNDYLLAEAAAHRDRLVPFIAAPLNEPSATAAEIARCRPLGARGIGELRPESNGCDLGNDRDGDILADHAAGLPLLIHVSEPAGHRYPGKGGQSIDGLWRFAVRHPEARVIAAHFGGGLPLYAHMPEVHAAFRHIWVDTAAWPLLYRPSIFRAVADLVGAARILFGTDFPLRSHARELRLLKRAPLDADEHRAVTGGSAATLLGLEG
jgi:predicted TIM-barrel fold metal-dependent hydrolase